MRARLAGSGLLAAVRRALALASYRVVDVAKVVLPLAIFFIKFLEWWYNAGYGKRVAAAAPLPPAPALLPVRHVASQWGRACPVGGH